MSDTTESTGSAESSTKKLKAKNVSKAGMVVGLATVLIFSSLKAFWNVLFPSSDFGLTMNDILWLGCVPQIICSPITVSIILEKVKDLKFGGTE